MFRTIAFAATAGSFLALPAFAGSPAMAPADPVPMAPVPMAMPASDWTGGYAGLQLGYGMLDFGGAEDEGIVYGGQLGYDYDMGSYVLGGEFDYTMADINFGGTDVDSMARAKLRAGYDAGPALIYVTGGAARADTSVGDDIGYVVGAGAEYKVFENVSVGAEYLYHKFDDFNGTGSDLSGSTVAAKVNYRF